MGVLPTYSSWYSFVVIKSNINYTLLIYKLYILQQRSHGHDIFILKPHKIVNKFLYNEHFSKVFGGMIWRIQLKVLQLFRKLNILSGWRLEKGNVGK